MTLAFSAVEVGATDSLAVAVDVLLILLLITEQVLSTLPGPRAKRLKNALTILLIPLLIAFMIVVIPRLAEAL